MHSEDWWATQKPSHVLRCTATLRTSGTQCRNEARPGTNVCDKHGALAPAVQAAAATRIRMSVHDAVKRLHDMLDDSSVDARDKIKILHDLLDRGGLGATSKHLIGVAEVDPVETLFQRILQDPNGLLDPNAAPTPLSPEMAALNRAADPQALAELGDEPDVVEAELVDEKAEPQTVLDDTGSEKPPPHILRDLKRLGLL
ncbi:hypothetical protein [Nocardioides lijunqiniae]|uniref:hypothetical protein n=1 Tax=Nocardioides lijunqiniae TaxID=2760832 RepID=UPI00187842B5|nr:hypothetical protein [Nocardioides lijunqiniae]